MLRTGLTSQVAVVATFIATLFLPVAAAVGFGVALSLILPLNREAVDLRIVSLVPPDGGTLVEQPAPKRLTSNAVTLLDVYGSLLYAGAGTLQARLPDPVDTERLGQVDGQLCLSGVDHHFAEQLQRIGAGPVRVFEATEVVGQSSRDAYRSAKAYLVSSDRAR